MDSIRLLRGIFILTSLTCKCALAQETFPERNAVNPVIQEPARNHAKFNFLAERAQRLGVSQNLIRAADALIKDKYAWSKTDITICFWNGTEEQQNEVMKYASTWERAVPRLKFVYQDNTQNRICRVEYLSNLERNSDIRINLNGNAPPSLWHPTDYPQKDGDWSHVGPEVAQNAKFPITMNLVGSMKMRDESQITDYIFNVRHEFGHALSLMHEHQSERCKEAFDIKQIAHDTGWSIEYAENAVNTLPTSSNTYLYLGVYNPNSIMQYNFLPRWYNADKPGWTNPCRRSQNIYDISELDRMAVASLYDPSLNNTEERQKLIAQIKVGVPASNSNGPASSKASERNVAAASLVSLSSKIRVPERIYIQIYPHKADQDIVLRAVSNLGYPLKDGRGNQIRAISKNVNESLISDPTTTILFTPDVSDLDVRYVAISLIKAGIALKSIRPYYPSAASKWAKRTNLIQIGASVTDRGKSPLSYDDVMTNPLPMYGHKSQE